MGLDDEMGLDDQDLARAARIVAEAERVVAVTGAGISAESGVPTFRGPEGLWRNYHPEELATPEAFSHDPRLVWEWYEWRRQRIAGCRPNDAHLALARAALRRGDVRILTQNVDGLHALAAHEVAHEVAHEAADEATDGAAGPALPIELHGSIFRVRCTSCRDRYAHREEVRTDSLETLPRCRGCGGLLRPDVVWFGEALDESALETAFDEAARADVCLVIGTSALVQPTASLPRVTQANGGRVIEINPEPTPLTATADVSLRARAAASVGRILDGPKLSDAGG